MTEKVGEFLSFYSDHNEHGAHIWDVKWSHNGELLASCAGDWSILIWSAQKKTAVARLKGHRTPVTSISWSFDCKTLASVSKDRELILWCVQDCSNPKILKRLSLASRIANDQAFVEVSWNPRKPILAIGRGGTSVTLLADEGGDWANKTYDDLDVSAALAWAPNGERLCYASNDHSVRVVEIGSEARPQLLRGHHGRVNSLAWSSDGQFLASASSDETIRIWDGGYGRPVAILEGHTNTVHSVAFSQSGRTLASRSQDNTLRLWRVGAWDVYSTISIPSTIHKGGVAFSPNANLLATKTNQDHTMSIWSFDELELADSSKSLEAKQYVNARVVLAGDTGVGKSGLSLVLTGKDFIPTESTHGRQVWTMLSKEEPGANGVLETREVLLWDLAGQPGYRLIHQLHLEEVVVALVIFDSRSEIEPLAGVFHWDRALQQAKLASPNTIETKKFLVSARNDRGGVPLSKSRIDSLVSRLNFEDYIETSSKENMGIDALRSKIIDSIEWDKLPRISSNTLFQNIKQYLVLQRSSSIEICTIDELYSNFVHENVDLRADNELRDKFETCVRLVESRGLIRRLSFGGLVLLQPELLDAYASSMIEAARRHPDGMGYLREYDAQTGNFFIPPDLKVRDPSKEQSLCIATIESLLIHELAFRQETSEGEFLIFPTQFTRDWEKIDRPANETAVYAFEGPILSIYARLVVRLSHSNEFKNKELWQNACTFVSKEANGECGLYLNQRDEGQAELSLFFAEGSSKELQGTFEKFVQSHLDKHGLPESTRRREVLDCSNCGERISANAIEIRVSKGLDHVNCSVCDTTVRLHLPENDAVMQRREASVSLMEGKADSARNLAVAHTVLDGKRHTGQFDTFISYNSGDKKRATELADDLCQRGMLPWIDVWNLPPGRRWHIEIEKVVDSIGSALVLIGQSPYSEEQKRQLAVLEEERRFRKKKHERQYLEDQIRRARSEFREENLGLGPWQSMEMDLLLRNFVERRLPIIPVILEGVEGAPRLPGFLQSFSMVDMRKPDQNPLSRIVWGMSER